MRRLRAHVVCGVVIAVVLLLTGGSATARASDGPQVVHLIVPSAPAVLAIPPGAGDYRDPVPVPPNNCIGAGSVNFANNPNAAMSTGVGEFACSLEWLNPPYPMVSIHVEIHEMTYAQGLMSGPIYTQGDSSSSFPPVRRTLRY